MNRIGDAAAVARAIEAAELVYIACHENPDGDAIGSLLGLRLGLLALDRQVFVASPTPPPERFAFLPGFEAIATELPAEPADLAIALDCDGIARLRDLQPAFAAAAVVADIDHHRLESAFGDIQFVTPEHAATATMVLEVLDQAEVALSGELAACLYTGLITDTGGFRFTNTNAHALRAGARLLEAGADPADLARRVFSLRRLGVRLLTARALSALHLAADGRVLISTLSLDDFAATGTGPDDTDGLIDDFRDTHGVEVAVLLKQLEPARWNASLRSQALDVAAVAASFGGGGHRLAAGCEIAGELAEVERELLGALKARLDGAGADA